MRIHHSLIAATLTAGIASGAFAAQTTIEFKTFYDTSTVFNLADQKTLPYSVASLKLVDIDNGVQATLTLNATDFPGSKLSVDELWLENSAKGSVKGSSGDLSNAAFYKRGFWAPGGTYNYDVNFKKGEFGEGETSKFTILGGGVTVASFLDPSGAAKGITLELTGVGAPYSAPFGLNRNVQFLGSVVEVPEPSSYALMALGLVGMAAVARRRQSV